MRPRSQPFWTDLPDERLLLTLQHLEPKSPSESSQLTILSVNDLIGQLSREKNGMVVA